MWDGFLNPSVLGDGLQNRLRMAISSPDIFVSPDLIKTDSAPPCCPTRRVLHVVNGEHYSGAERVQDLLADRLPQFGFQAAFACVKPDRFPRLLNSQQAPVYATVMRSRWDLRPVRQLVELVRKGPFDLLHAHTPRTALLTAIAAGVARVPWVYHVHSPATRDSTYGWQNRLNAVVEHVSLSRASALIAVSESLGNRLRRWRRFQNRVFVVPNGVPCREPRPMPTEGDSRRRQRASPPHVERRDAPSPCPGPWRDLPTGAAIRLQAWRRTAIGVVGRSPNSTDGNEWSSTFPGGSSRR